MGTGLCLTADMLNLRNVLKLHIRIGDEFYYSDAPTFTDGRNATLYMGYNESITAEGMQIRTVL